MKDTGMTLFGMKVYESDAMKEGDPPMVLGPRPVSLTVRAETTPDGRTGVHRDRQGRE